MMVYLLIYKILIILILSFSIVFIGWSGSLLYTFRHIRNLFIQFWN